MSSIERAIDKLNRRATTAPTPPASQDAGVPPDRQPVGTPLPGSERATGAEQSRAKAKKPQIALDFKALSRAGFLTTDSMDGVLAEQYRNIKRPLLNFATGRVDRELQHANLVAVTSALRGEGKTFTAFNLAMSIAMEQDISVLLVDGDLIARSLTHLVGLDDAPGLTDVLIDGQTGLAQVIVGTNVPKLNVLPAGRVSRNTTELLASEQMQDVVRELSERYQNRVVLFDTAPILMASQAMVLDALVGQAVLVVEEGRTPQPAIQDAVAMLNKDKAVGAVLNKSRRPATKDYSYGRYGTY
jgi:exopolysaccharide/PEP-CTERM locus tyrosine autokinase